MSLPPSSSSVSLPELALAREQTTPSTPVEFTTNPLDDFFGYTLTSASTRESRHDRRISLAASEALPPYDLPPPEYQVTAEPLTLAMYLFKFGFLFPPFWILGALILISPLHAPSASADTPAWMPEKTESEREALISYLRKAELKWAWRCMIAMIVLCLLGTVAGIAAWYITRA